MNVVAAVDRMLYERQRQAVCEFAVNTLAPIAYPDRTAVCESLTTDHAGVEDETSELAARLVDDSPVTDKFIEENNMFEVDKTEVAELRVAGGDEAGKADTERQAPVKALGRPGRQETSWAGREALAVPRRRLGAAGGAVGLEEGC